jgi:hypothetical protein
MRRILIAVVVAGCLVALSPAQDSTQAGASASQQGQVAAGQSGAQAQSNSSMSASQPAQATPVPAGSLIYAELSKSIDAKKAKAGDEISAKTTQVVLAHGNVVIPKGAKLVGHVTQAQARTKDQEHSELGITFDHALLKDGTQIPLTVSIQALGNAHPNPNFDSQAESSPMGAGAGMPAGAGSSAPGRPGGVLGTAGSTVGGVANTAGGAAGTIAGGTPEVVAGGHLDPSSRGVIGLSNLSLSTSTGTSAQGSVITSDKRNVKLDSGTEFVLRAN